MFRVVAVDDDPTFLRALGRMLTARGFEVVAFETAGPALALLEAEREQIDLVLLDRNLPGGDGLDVLIEARRIAPDVPQIVLTGDASDSTAAAALRAGAFHFLTKPVEDVDSMVLTLLRACHFARLQRRARSLEHKVAVSEQFEHMVGSSAAMRELFAVVARVAETDLPVLIHGESGTGKELTARAIHERSSRARGPFVALNCGAIPESLIDSELFGHTRGAFTGAVEARPGVFLEAHGGTLLLDEIGELPLAVQTRLLRVLQEHEVRAIGGSGTRKIDVRVIAATHVDLIRAVDEKRFRADLFYRLNVVAVHLPALRQRLDDIPLLASHLVAKYAARMRRDVPSIDPAVIEQLCRHSWPGNVRELENVVQRALAMTRGDVIGLDALPASFIVVPAAAPPPAVPAVEPPPDADPLRWTDSLGYREAKRQNDDRFDRAYFQRLLARAGGNLSEAARLAGLDRSNFRRTLARIGLKRPAAAVDGDERDDDPHRVPS